MATLTPQQRAAVKAAFVDTLNSAREQISVTKADVQAAVDAADAWADANAVSYNSALPLPARTQLTARQKAAILMFVIAQRFKSGA